MDRELGRGFWAMKAALGVSCASCATRQVSGAKAHGMARPRDKGQFASCNTRLSLPFTVRPNITSLLCLKTYYEQPSERERERDRERSLSSSPPDEKGLWNNPIIFTSARPAGALCPSATVRLPNGLAHEWTGRTPVRHERVVL